MSHSPPLPAESPHAVLVPIPAVQRSGAVFQSLAAQSPASGNFKRTLSFFQALSKSRLFMVIERHQSGTDGPTRMSKGHSGPTRSRHWLAIGQDLLAQEDEFVVELDAF